MVTVFMTVCAGIRAPILGIVSWKIWVGIAGGIVGVIDPIVPIIITVITATALTLGGDHKNIEPKMDGRKL